MELTINDKVYSFRFGIAFMRDIDQLETMDTPLGAQPVGFAKHMAGVMDGELLDLSDVLLVANKTESPKIGQSTLNRYLEDVDADTLDSIFKETIDFLSKSNACRNKLKTILKQLKAEDGSLPNITYLPEIEV